MLAAHAGSTRAAAPAPSTERGFTIVEVMVAAFVLLIGVLATLALFDRANAATVVDRQREAATSLAREITEGARSIPFDDLVSTNLNVQLQRMPGLEDDTAGGGQYTILRRGTAFTVVTELCTVDDVKDGGGSRPSNVTFCGDSTPAGTQDKNPEDYRRVTVTLSWRNGNVTRSVTQTGIVNNPGNGPGVLSVVPSGWGAPYEITSDVSPLRILITTSAAAQAVSWSVDGTEQAAAPTQNGTTGLAWQADWPIAGLDDGPYVVTADSFDAKDASGPSRSETITLNRFLARKPTGFAGGRNGFGAVDMEWNANTERDIIGYEVERTDQTGNATGQIVCGFVQQKLDTTCTDTSPSNADLIYYHVRAYDKAPGTGAARPGPWSDTLTVVKSNQPPFAPLNLNASTTNGGTSSAIVTLTWQRPAPQDSDAGDSIAFFRIYRDGTRYDRWYQTGSLLSWQDVETGAAKHDYYVTAVDTHYGESPATVQVNAG